MLGSVGDAAQSDPSMEAKTQALHAGLGPGYRDVVAGRYKLIEHIADGGMGSVFIAEHVLSHKKMAMKVVHPYLCRGEQGVERFRREVSAAATIDHPGIVQVYDAGVDDDGGFFMAMELLEGESLGDRLRRDWPGMASAVKIIEGMLEPLAKAHRKGFIHRDLKPDNVFLAKDDEDRERVKLLDFGLARDVEKAGPTRTGITFGTPEYMSPEQAMSARKVRSPGDVWSVGVMLYELLSGTHPFDGETPNAIMANAIKEPLPPLTTIAPHVPEPLVRLIERSLEKEAADRPQTAGELLEELRAVTAVIALDETVPDAPKPPTDWNSADGAPSISVDLPIPKSRRTETPTEAAHDAAEPAPSLGSLKKPILPGLIGLALLIALGLGGAVAYVFTRPSPDEVAETDEVETDEPDVEAPDPEPVADVEEPVVEEPEQPEPAVEDTVEEPVAEVAPEETPSAPVAAARARPAPAPEAQSGAALTEARACLARNDRACAISALRGRARSREERALLIGLYEETGRTTDWLNEMQSFVRRFRRDGRSAGYRETLARYGR